MQEWLRAHGASAGALSSLLGVAAVLSLVVPVPAAPAESGSPVAVPALALPDAAHDADSDTYGDDVDGTPGDLQASVRLVSLSLASPDAEPYVLLGTQDDQWRSGAGSELAWRHVVDPDSLGFKAGSPAWQDSVLRTGAWWMSRPGDGLDVAIARSNLLGGDGAPGAHWPQTLRANVRDDRATVRLDLELRDADTDPHALRGVWGLEFDVRGRLARVAGETEWRALPATQVLVQGASRLEVQLDLLVGLDPEVAQQVARTWAPTLRFDAQEEFFPVPGELLEEFHGFARPRPADINLRTWDFSFNAGRDLYRLHLADFTGDGKTDRADAAALMDVLAESPLGAPTVYAQADWSSDGQVVVQYWFLYLYNFVLDANGAEIARLAHKGDREFVQLTFPSLEAARNGTPTAVAYSQHYEGLLVQPPGTAAGSLQPGNFTVYVARGSHANFPQPGDDRRLRSSLDSLYDRFDGRGPSLAPGDYTLAMLGPQPWHAGYNWGPVSRYGRDLGVASKPLLQHDFRYPFTDPIWWQAGLRTAEPDDLEAMYGALP